MARARGRPEEAGSIRIRTGTRGAEVGEAGRRGRRRRGGEGEAAGECSGEVAVACDGGRRPDARRKTGRGRREEEMGGASSGPRGPATGSAGLAQGLPAVATWRLLTGSGRCSAAARGILGLGKEETRDLE